MKQAREQVFKHDEERIPLKEGASSREANKQAGGESKRSG